LNPETTPKKVEQQIRSTPLSKEKKSKTKNKKKQTNKQTKKELKRFYLIFIIKRKFGGVKASIDCIPLTRILQK
jgi:hypothetical protein